MPRRTTPVRELLEAENIPGSPLRRSSRLSLTTNASSTPQRVASPVPKEPRTRKSSVNRDGEEESSTKPAPRTTRRASVTRSESSEDATPTSSDPSVPVAKSRGTRASSQPKEETTTKQTLDTRRPITRRRSSSHDTAAAGLPTTTAQENETNSSTSKKVTTRTRNSLSSSSSTIQDDTGKTNDEVEHKPLTRSRRVSDQNVVMGSPVPALKRSTSNESVDHLEPIEETAADNVADGRDEDEDRLENTADRVKKKAAAPVLDLSIINEASFVEEEENDSERTDSIEKESDREQQPNVDKSKESAATESEDSFRLNLTTTPNKDDTAAVELQNTSRGSDKENVIPEVSNDTATTKPEEETPQQDKETKAKAENKTDSVEESENAEKETERLSTSKTENDTDMSVTGVETTETAKDVADKNKEPTSETDKDKEADSDNVFASKERSTSEELLAVNEDSVEPMDVDDWVLLESPESVSSGKRQSMKKSDDKLVEQPRPNQLEEDKVSEANDEVSESVVGKEQESSEADDIDVVGVGENRQAVEKEVPKPGEKKAVSFENHTKQTEDGSDDDIIECSQDPESKALKTTKEHSAKQGETNLEIINENGESRIDDKSFADKSQNNAEENTKITEAQAEDNTLADESAKNSEDPETINQRKVLSEITTNGSSKAEVPQEIETTTTAVEFSSITAEPVLNDSKASVKKSPSPQKRVSPRKSATSAKACKMCDDHPEGATHEKVSPSCQRRTSPRKSPRISAKTDSSEGDSPAKTTDNVKNTSNVSDSGENHCEEQDASETSRKSFSLDEVNNTGTTNETSNLEEEKPSEQSVSEATGKSLKSGENDSFAFSSDEEGDGRSKEISLEVNITSEAEGQDKSSVADISNPATSVNDEHNMEADNPNESNQSKEIKIQSPIIASISNEKLKILSDVRIKLTTLTPSHSPKIETTPRRSTNDDKTESTPKAKELQKSAKKSEGSLDMDDDSVRNLGSNSSSVSLRIDTGGNNSEDMSNKNSPANVRTPLRKDGAPQKSPTLTKSEQERLSTLLDEIKKKKEEKDKEREGAVVNEEHTINEEEKDRSDEEMEEEEDNKIENEFLDTMAEEGEEDTPSEGSNDIVDLGESINSESTDEDPEEDDDDYEKDSFITDGDESFELLSGTEHDLDDEVAKKKKSRIVVVNDSDSDAAQKIKKITAKKAKKKLEKSSAKPIPVKKMKKRIKEPSESSGDEEKQTLNKSSKQDSSATETGLVDEGPATEKSAEIEGATDKDHEQPESADKVPDDDIISVQDDSEADQLETRTAEADVKIETPKRKRLSSSISVSETLKIAEGNKSRVSDHIQEVVNLFMSSIKESGSLALNVSMEYSGKTPNDSDESVHGAEKSLEAETVEDLAVVKQSSEDRNRSTVNDEFEEVFSSNLDDSQLSSPSAEKQRKRRCKRKKPQKEEPQQQQQKELESTEEQPAQSDKKSATKKNKKKAKRSSLNLYEAQTSPVADSDENVSRTKPFVTESVQKKTPRTPKNTAQENTDIVEGVLKVWQNQKRHSQDLSNSLTGDSTEPTDKDMINIEEVSQYEGKEEDEHIEPSPLIRKRKAMNKTFSTSSDRDTEATIDVEHVPADGDDEEVFEPEDVSTEKKKSQSKKKLRKKKRKSRPVSENTDDTEEMSPPKKIKLVEDEQQPSTSKIAQQKTGKKKQKSKSLDYDLTETIMQKESSTKIKKGKLKRHHSLVSQASTAIVDMDDYRSSDEQSQASAAKKSKKTDDVTLTASENEFTESDRKKKTRKRRQRSQSRKRQQSQNPDDRQLSVVDDAIRQPYTRIWGYVPAMLPTPSIHSNQSSANEWQEENVVIRTSVKNVSIPMTDDGSSGGRDTAKFHPRDFRNRTLYDPGHVRRIESKKMLKKRGAF